MLSLLTTTTTTTTTTITTTTTTTTTTTMMIVIVIVIAIVIVIPVLILILVLILVLILTLILILMLLTLRRRTTPPSAPAGTAGSGRHSRGNYGCMKVKDDAGNMRKVEENKPRRRKSPATSKTMVQWWEAALELLGAMGGRDVALDSIKHTNS